MPRTAAPPKTCRIDLCTQPSRSDGMCEKHYSRVRRNGDPFTVRRLPPYPDDLLCSVPGCTRRPHARGWCSNHYKALRPPLTRGGYTQLR